jgi:hypothetical protein
MVKLNPCNTGNTDPVVDALKRNAKKASDEAAAVGSTAVEIRQVASSSNNGRPGSYNASTIGQVIIGMRNRLYLKYLGIDYEFFNVYDMRYRDTV